MDLARHVASFSDEAGESGSLYDLIVHGRPKWWRDAACLEHPEVNFFPERGQDIRPAKRVCENCLVRWPCQEWALQQDTLLQGVFGGLSWLERQKIRRRT